jgi:hypothetical protein
MPVRPTDLRRRAGQARIPLQSLEQLQRAFAHDEVALNLQPDLRPHGDRDHVWLNMLTTGDGPVTIDGHGFTSRDRR